MSKIRAESGLFGQHENKREKTRFGANFRESGRTTFKASEMSHKATSFSISFRTPDIANFTHNFKGSLTAAKVKSFESTETERTMNVSWSYAVALYCAISA